MRFSALISQWLSQVGIKIINKSLFKTNYFKKESFRLMEPIVDQYETLICKYPTSEDRRKGIENQTLFVEMVHWLGLEKSQPLKILDIGGRGGLFAYFCKCYGHDSYVSDIPGVLSVTPNKELLELLQVKSLDIIIRPFTPMDTYGLKFDLVTGFRTRFHSRLPFETGKQYEEHWGVPEWRYFLQDLANNTLSGSGRIFFMLNRLQEREKKDYVPAELQTYFKSVGGKLRQNFLYFPTTANID